MGGWSLVHPASHLALTAAALLFLATLAFVVPTLVAMRRRTAVDATVWADRLRRDDGAAWATDRVIRSVEASCDRAGVVFPGVVRIVVGPVVRLDLAAPTVAPPAPWTATPDGRSWSAPMGSLQEIPLVGAPSDAFATVVALGGGEDGTVLVDLRRVGGFVALSGDRTARSAVARRVVDQVHTDPWSAGTPVLSVGIEQGTMPGTAQVSLRDAIAAVTEDATAGLLVLASIPGGSDGAELARLLERPGGRWAAVVLSTGPLARWTLEARRDGTLVSDVLGTVRWMDTALSEPVDTDEVEEPSTEPQDVPAGRVGA
jgi:hypothetical protein